MNKRERGDGCLFQDSYRDKRTGEKVKCATWTMKLWVGGKALKKSAETTSHSKAIKKLDAWKAQVRGGNYVPGADKTTFQDLAALLTDEYRANGRKSVDRVQDAIEHLRAFFTDHIRASAITADRVLAYVRQRQEQGAANATINRESSALKRMFRLSERAGLVARRPHIAMLQESNVRTGFFEPQDFEAVLSHLDDYLKAPLATAYITGWRLRSEILTRQKCHLDLKAGWLRLEPGETKNGEGRQFPLTPALRAVLEAQAERTREIEKKTGKVIPWLFHRKGKPIKSFRRAWLTACLKAGFARLVSEKPRVIETYRIPHDFRRTAIRNLERAGVPRSAAMTMVGHKTESVYRRYAICDEATLREGAARLQSLHDLQGASAWTGGVSSVMPLAARRSVRVPSESALTAEVAR
jgi:site-specific recombinase XerD